MPGKMIELQDAAALVPDGATLSIGGFTTQRHPMAFVYELIRRRRRDLYLFGHSPGGDWDILIGAGCVKSFVPIFSPRAATMKRPRCLDAI